MKIKNLKMVCLFIFIFFCLKPENVRAADVEFTFFYNNSCASCKEDEEIYDLFNRCFSSEEKGKMDYEVRVLNVFLESGKKVFQEYCSAYEEEVQGQEFPVLAVGQDWIVGYEQIENYLKTDFKEKEIEKIEETNTKDTKDTKEKIEKETNKNQILESFLEELEKEEKEEDSLVIFLFTTYSCEDCKKVKEFLKDYPIDIQIKEYNIGEENYVELVQSLYTCYSIEEKQQQVPAVFFGGHAYTGEKNIVEALENHEAVKKDASYRAFRDYVLEHASVRTKEELRYLPLFLSGLLAGFNPCGISMLLMLLSVLLTSKTSVLKNGGLYVLAKMITYFGIGVGAYFAVSAAFSAGLEKVSQIVTGIMAVLLLLLAVLNFIDFRNVRRQEYGKIRVQLPVGLRKWNHRMIKKLTGTSEKMVPFLAFGLGIAISFGEFFCTGQIYMASILYMMRTNTEELFKVLLMFAIYVFAMMLPTIVVLFVIHKTHSAERISEFMLRRMDLIKLLNAILFFAFFIYLILGLL